MNFGQFFKGRCVHSFGCPFCAFAYKGPKSMSHAFETNGFFFGSHTWKKIPQTVPETASE